VVTVTAALQRRFGERDVAFLPTVSPSDTTVNMTAIAHALAAARSSDVIVMVLGDSGEGTALFPLSLSLSPPPPPRIKKQPRGVGGWERGVYFGFD
jgi:hypothetical protein